MEWPDKHGTRDPKLDSCHGSATNKPRNLAAALAVAKSRQSCLTLCDPIDGSPPGSPIPGILQARTLEWVAISFSTRNLEQDIKSQNFEAL